MSQQLQERRAQLISYVAADPKNPALLTDLAISHYQLGSFSDAQSTALAALEISPQQAQAHAILGLAAIATMQLSSAIEHLTAAIELGDAAPLLRYQLAHALIQTGDYESAETHALIAAQHSDELPLAPALYIRALHYLGKMEEAITYGEQCCENPQLATAPLLGALASVYMDEDDLENAQRVASRAIALNPNDIDSNITLGMLALAEADGEQALSTFKSLTEERPSNGRAWLGLGLAQLLTGSLDTAVEPLQKAAATMQNHPGTLIALAWTHILSKKANEAEGALTAALKIDKTFAEVHGSLAVVALMKGNLDSAIQSSKRANGLDRDNFSGNFANSLIKQVSGNGEQARAIVEKLLSTNILPGEQSIHSVIAKVFSKGL